MSLPRTKNRRQLSGFTIAEILVVVMVLAIAAMVVLPYVTSTTDLEVVSAARLLAADLQYAQNVAITDQEPVTVTIEAAGDSYRLWSNESDPLIHPITKSDYRVDFASERGFSHLDIVSADFGGASAVTFDSLGAPDSAGTITLQAGSHVYRLSVADITGKVTVAAVGS